MLFINNAEVPYSEQSVTLGSNVYLIEFKYNSRNEGWYISIKDSSGEDTLLGGIKLVPNQVLTSRYIIDGFEGQLMCARVKNSSASLGLDNLGRDKTYRLVWFSEDEAEATGLDDNVQIS